MGRILHANVALSRGGQATLASVGLWNARLDGLSVDILTMSDFVDRYLVMFVINKVDDSVTSLPHPVTVGVPCKFLGPLGPRIPSQSLQSLNDALAVGLGAYGLKLLRRRSFD